MQSISYHSRSDVFAASQLDSHCLASSVSCISYNLWAITLCIFWQKCTSLVTLCNCLGTEDINCCSFASGIFAHSWCIQDLSCSTVCAQHCPAEIDMEFLGKVILTAAYVSPKFWHKRLHQRYLHIYADCPCRGHWRTPIPSQRLVFGSFLLVRVWMVFFIFGTYNPKSEHVSAVFSVHLRRLWGPQNSAAFQHKIKDAFLSAKYNFKLHFLMQWRTVLSDNDFPKYSWAYVHLGSITVFSNNTVWGLDGHAHSPAVSALGLYAPWFPLNSTSWILSRYYDLWIVKDNFCNLALRNIVVELTDNSLTMFGSKSWTTTHPCLQRQSLVGRSFYTQSW